MNNKINVLKKMIDESKNIVVFTGAGVSTESGIKDFRSKDGLYNINYKYPPEQILSHSFFIDNTDEFYKFYKNKMNCLNYSPNSFHYYLKELENQNKLKAIITQNIDGLHNKANSKNVYELHGTVYRNYCMKCKKEYSAEFVFNSKNIPTCECGGIIKPDVVLYEEALNDNILDSSIKAIESADMMIIAGTSLTVYPASGLVNYFRGKYLVILNRDTTNYDNKANLIINDSLKNIIQNLKEI